MSTATKTAHTPTPWDIETKGSKHFIDGADGLTVAYIDRAGVRPTKEIEANAALIVRAVNSHAELVAALELALKGLELACEKNLPEFIGFALAADKARVALAKAQA